MLDIKSHMKRLQKIKKDKKKHWESLSQERRDEILELRRKPLSIARQLITLVWDYKHQQLNEGKNKYMRELLDIRLKEIEDGSKELFKDEKEKYERIRGDLKNV